MVPAYPLPHPRSTSQMVHAACASAMGTQLLRLRLFMSYYPLVFEAIHLAIQRTSW